MKKKGKIFDSSITSPAIKVLDKKDQLINEDIFLVTATFWNAGELPIEPEHIRKPVHINLSSVKRILDYKILNQVDPDIARIKIEEVVTPKGQTSNSELRVTWSHLDPGYGARFQIIYIGEEDTEVSFSGKISGVDKIKNSKPLGKRYKFIETIFTIFIILIIAFVSEFIKTGFKNIKNNKSKSIFNFTVGISIILLISFIYFFVIKGPTPPI